MEKLKTIKPTLSFKVLFFGKISGIVNKVELVVVKVELK